MSLSIMILIDNDIQFKYISEFLSDLIFLVFSLFFNLVKIQEKILSFKLHTYYFSLVIYPKWLNKEVYLNWYTSFKHKVYIIILFISLQQYAVSSTCNRSKNFVSIFLG